MKKIIYPNEKDPTRVSLIIPTGLIPLEEVARKDVPAGVPYLIVDAEDLPEDHYFFEAWEADFSTPDGYGIGQKAWFEEQEALKEQAIEREVQEQPLIQIEGVKDEN